MTRIRIAAVATALTLAAAGCGDDDGEGSQEKAAPPKPTTMTVKISGDAKQPTLTVPKSVKGGLVTIEVTNEAKGDHGVQLVRAEDGHTPEEALAAAGAWGEQNKPLPDWAIVAGGVGSVGTGESETVTQSLPAGSYMAVDIDTNANAPFEVTGGGGESPTASASISATEYAFEATGLKAGANEVLFENKGKEPHFIGDGVAPLPPAPPILIDNKGKEPHFIAALPIKPGKTIADVKKFFRTEEGEPPILEEGSFDTAVMEGGDKQAIELELERGKYLLLCFVPDREGGRPHAAKGMISEASVE